MTDQPRDAAEYALGYSEREKERLVIQSRIYGDLTEWLFRMAGIQPGMSVLDVGCGVGDVSLLAASIVGPAGSVLGVDRATDSIATARGRAQAAGLENVAFEVATLL
jgi:ubiquinone/menaquinone biosynthesis C-methylase UbiE